MKSKYLVIDVETPNGHNDALCQIGMIYLDDNLNVIKEVSQLINPEEEFGIINIRLTGITSGMVSSKPKFNEFWEEVKNDFYNNIIVCHNKSTDLVVIDKHLQHYGISFLDKEIRYIDTLQICQCDCNFKSNQLKKVCEELCLKVEKAHDALHDAKMCAELFKYFVKHNYLMKASQYTGYGKYSRNHSKEIKYSQNYSDETNRFKDLNEFLSLFIEDKIVSNEEMNFIYEWLSSNSDLSGHFQYDQIYELVENVFADNIVDEEENKYLCKKIFEIINPTKSDDIFVDDDYVIDFESKKFVITGDFECGKSRSEIENIIISKGGIIAKSVSKKTNYLIVGNKGSAFWSQGSYGTKIQKAIDCKINIVKEKTFLKNVGE